jgi:hypothetical protein
LYEDTNIRSTANCESWLRWTVRVVTVLDPKLEGMASSGGLAHGERWLLGSIASAVASRAHCSVEVVRSI